MVHSLELSYNTKIKVIAYKKYNSLDAKTCLFNYVILQKIMYCVSVKQNTVSDMLS